MGEVEPLYTAETRGNGEINPETPRKRGKRREIDPHTPRKRGGRAKSIPLLAPRERGEVDSPCVAMRGQGEAVSPGARGGVDRNR
jgi:hypothetical protein